VTIQRAMMLQGFVKGVLAWPKRVI